ncbi:MAG TPA: hypothetical protein VJL29_00670 [Thermoguttaceae bacterium]|nr:hypothetical protein [Thermoguttaceae bacterium]
METIGFEQNAQNQGETSTGGGKCAHHNARGDEHVDGLAEVVAAWPGLPAQTRQAIVALARGAGGRLPAGPR